MDTSDEATDGLEARESARLRAEILSSPDLPAMPLSYARLLAILASERSTPQELVEVLELEPALAAKVLRLANSAFLGRSGTVGSLSRAVLLLGWKWVSSLALGVSVWGAFALRGRAPAIRLWGHSARVALAARLLARHLGQNDAEMVFSAGLLHDLGRAVLVVRHPMHADSIAEPGGDDRLERERIVFGAHHAEIGGWLATAWGLPEPIAAAMRGHHEDLRPGDGIDACTIVRIADQLIRDVEIENSDPVEAHAHFVATLEAIAPGHGLSASWGDLVTTVRNEGRDLEQIFAGSI